MLDFIQKTVRHPLWPALKDAYVAYSPNGDDKSEPSLIITLGKLKGATFVFNDMERIARTQPKPTKPTPGGTRDPDLNEEP